MITPRQPPLVATYGYWGPTNRQDRIHLTAILGTLYRNPCRLVSLSQCSFWNLENPKLQIVTLEPMELFFDANIMPLFATCENQFHIVILSALVLLPFQIVQYTL